MTLSELVSKSMTPAVACVLALTLSGCPDDDESQTTETSPTGKAIAKSSRSGPSFVAEPTVFEGTWLGACTSGDGQTATIQKFIFSGNIYQARVVAFQDAQCSAGGKVVSNEIGQFSLQPGVTTDTGVMATPVQFDSADGVRYQRLMFLGTNGLYFGSLGADQASPSIDFAEVFAIRS